MRIGLVIERFEPRGGVEAAAWAIAHALVERGCEVHVFAREAEMTPGPQVHRLEVASAWQPWRVAAFSRAAARAAPRGDFDAVHSFSRTRHQDVLRTGGGCHAAYMERAYGRFGAAWRRASPRHATLLAIEGAALRDPSQRIHCNSTMVEAEILERYRVSPERISVIPNGVDLERFRPRSAEDECGARALRLRGELGAEEGAVWLLLGHGEHRKGVDTALRALARAADRRAQLWLAGRHAEGGAAKLADELGVADRVRRLGTAHDPALLYAAADALVLPTRYDAFANVCLEAAACGLPVLTSGANGAAAWLGAAGLCVEDPEDVEGFAAALDTLGDPERRASLGRAARTRAETRSWAACASELCALYAELRP
jgi:UDP-glucose:(heptosyl)LPS alpha-1,3-glucosyltransferase